MTRHLRNAHRQATPSPRRAVHHPTPLTTTSARTVDVPGRACSRKCTTPLSNAPDPVGAVERVGVTHPFHPLRGHEIEAAYWRRSWREDRVYYRDSAGHLRSLPTAWTSLAAPDPFLLASQGKAFFRPADLLRLSDLIKQRGDRQVGLTGDSKEN